MGTHASKMSTPSNFGSSKLETLPPEILEMILKHCLLPFPSLPDTLEQEQKLNYGRAIKTSRKFPSCIMISKHIYQIGESLLYHHLTFPTQAKYQTIINKLRANPQLGKKVRTLNTRPLQRGMSSAELKEIVELMPFLQGMNIMLQTFKDCTYDLSSLGRLTSFECGWFIDVRGKEFPPIDPELVLPAGVTKYGLRNVRMISFAALEKHLAQLPRLRELEICLRNDRGDLIKRIPASAKLSVLSLSKHPNVLVDKLVETLLTHSAFTHLVVLNCDGIWNSARDEKDLTQLLSHLPSTVRFLNLRGSYLTQAHVPHLRRVCSQLEELRLGNPMKELFAEPPVEYPDMLRLSDVEEIVLAEKPKILRMLDISGICLEEQLKLQESRLLSLESLPLEVILLEQAHEAIGWELIQGSGRLWMVRKPLGC
ncbi:hypothetical protein EG329_008867 [Mollisiaceae sp. DMI_Dod_QoI]|nr:hypothetical protein EG329_008867 [Helotiales sp. DMI_Dod_QoI]